MINNVDLEPAKMFFPGEHVAVTGKVSLRKGHRETDVDKAAQIKPVLADNIVMSGGL